MLSEYLQNIKSILCFEMVACSGILYVKYVLVFILYRRPGQRRGVDIHYRASEGRRALRENFFDFHWHATLSTNRMEIYPTDLSSHENERYVMKNLGS